MDVEKQEVATTLTDPVSTENALSTCIDVEKKEGEAPLYYRSSRVLQQQQQQPALSPNVAKLFRGELLPSGPPTSSTAKLYDYIRKNAWSKEDLKDFEINDELDYGNQQIQ
uniref:Uncharacterized protein n=1 Tax=Meloidogyne hapla TaxID=6305 RepID=A0A1I8C2C5_MELHA